jgi:hypothetical protein
VDEADLALMSRAGHYATEVLQFVVLYKAVDIATIVSVGSISGAEAVFRDGEIGLSDMSRVFAHEGKDTKNLGNNKYSDNPRAQTTRYGCWKHEAQMSCCVS